MMWNEIKKNGIVAQTANSEGNFASTVPEGTASLVADRLINMIQWIHDEFTEDASIQPDILQSDSFEQRDAFVIRNTSRVLSYVNHVCVLELILVKLYKETIPRLQVIDPSISVDTTGLSSRKSEVEECFTFRNKVSAHTAYGSPRGDNLAMELHSLVTLLSSSYDETGKSDSFALGAVSVRLAGEAPSTRLPCIGIKSFHTKMLSHIEEWTKMIISPCLQARESLPVTIGDTKYLVR